MTVATELGRRLGSLRAMGVGVSQRIDEFGEAWRRVRAIRPATFVEIGSASGGSLWLAEGYRVERFVQRQRLGGRPVAGIGVVYIPAGGGQ